MKKMFIILICYVLLVFVASRCGNPFYNAQWDKATELAYEIQRIENDIDDNVLKKKEIIEAIRNHAGNAVYSNGVMYYKLEPQYYLESNRELYYLTFGLFGKGTPIDTYMWPIKEFEGDGSVQ